MSSGCDKVCIWSNNSEKAGFEKRRNRSVSFSIVFKFRKGECVAAKFFYGFCFTCYKCRNESAGKKVDGGLAPLIDKKNPKRATSIVPAGARGLRHFAQHCTACQLCVSVCPNQILRPSGDLKRLMQPEMSYERGYCRPECAKCAEVCPTDAIHLTSLAEKSAIQIGHAVWIAQNCIVNTDKVSCGNCARHCPTGAIQMIPKDENDESSPKIPVVNTERCIGCGACENLCPARPFSAIYVEGHEMHRVI